MRKSLKKVIVLFCISSVMIPFISCGNNASNTDKSECNSALKTYIDAYKREKDVDYNNVGINDEQLKELVDKRDYNLTKILKLNNERIKDKDILKSIYNDLGKVNINIKKTEVKEEQASVEIEAKSMDIGKIQSSSLSEAKKKLSEDETGDKKLADIYIEILKGSLENIELTETNNYTVKLVKNSDGKWIVEDDNIAILENAICSNESYEVYDKKLPEEFKEILRSL